MIIVTIQFLMLNKRKSYDMEIPTDVPFSVVVAQIAETINSYNPSYNLSSLGMCLESKRLGRVLNYDETVESAGIWNGDFLIYRGI